jgi:hypothetical protein
VFRVDLFLIFVVVLTIVLGNPFCFGESVQHSLHSKAHQLKMPILVSNGSLLVKNA